MIELGRGILEWAIALTTLAGAIFYFGAALGLVRLPDFYTRVHSPAKAATLGTMLLATAALLGNIRTAGLEVIPGDLLLIFFLFVTGSVSAQVLMRAAAARGVAADPRTRGEPPAATCEHVEETGELARKIEPDGRL